MNSQWRARDHDSRGERPPGARIRAGQAGILDAANLKRTGWANGFRSVARLALVVIFGAASAGSGDEAGALPPRAGQEIFESCRLCHSTKEMQRGPILDALPPWYLTLQLNKYATGVRGADAGNRSDVLMASTMSLLRGEEEIRRVAGFIGSLPPQRHVKTIRGDAVRGRTLYLSCIPCHGEQAQGNLELKGPPLNVQEDWYLLDQMRKFKTGQRGGDPRDLEGKIMQQAVAAMDMKDFPDVIHYISLTLARTNGAARSGSVVPAR